MTGGDAAVGRLSWRGTRSLRDDKEDALLLLDDEEIVLLLLLDDKEFVLLLHLLDNEEFVRLRDDDEM